MVNASELREQIAALYKQWDPSTMNAKELHDLDDQIYQLEDQLDMLREDDE